MRPPGSRRRPQAERAVDMHPRAGVVGDITNFGGGIASARVDVSCLNADDRGADDRRQSVRHHSSLPVGRNANHTITSESQERQRTQQRRVDFIADDDRDRRRAE